MKRYKIQHQTTYEYSSEVQLAPHLLLLRPREGHELRIISSKLNIFPEATISWHRDVEGNSVASPVFSDKTDILKIESEILIEKYDLLPFDFLVEEYAVNFPFYYEKEDLISLKPYLNFQQAEKPDPILDWIGKMWLSGDKLQTFTLLFDINQHLHNAFTYQKREEEGVQSPEQTLSTESGSCRDYAYLFMVVAQRLGLASRFVSGYLYSQDSLAWLGATHAWAEVFIPGAGWKGFDPTNGTLVGAEHIAVAVARHPELVPPVSGKFYGSSDSTMSVSVLVSEIE
ncbi:MAG: transglutaminase family protein [Gammaproteobacteria bacterium]|nr:transglutaminase family protein [Gammaproteobacteria bacterium]